MASLRAGAGDTPSATWRRSGRAARSPSGVVGKPLHSADLIMRYGWPASYFLSPALSGSDMDHGVGVYGREDFARLAALLAGIAGRFIYSVPNASGSRETLAGLDTEDVDLTYTIAGSKVRRRKRSLRRQRLPPATPNRPTTGMGGARSQRRCFGTLRWSRLGGGLQTPGCMWLRGVPANHWVADSRGSSQANEVDGNVGFSDSRPRAGPWRPRRRGRRRRRWRRRAPPRRGGAATWCFPRCRGTWRSGRKERGSQLGNSLLRRENAL